MNDSNYLVLDVETGGLHPYPTKLKDKQGKEYLYVGNPITQVACLILDSYTLKEINRFETFVKPYNNLIYEKSALEVTQVKMSDINNGTDPKVLVNLLTTFWDKYIPAGKRERNRMIIVGHNIKFDIGFLKYLFSEVGGTKGKFDLFNYIQEQAIDTYADSKRAYGTDKGIKHNLKALTERMGIPLKNAHGAMNDAIATAEVFREFTKRLRSEGGDEVEQGAVKKKKTRDFFEF